MVYFFKKLLIFVSIASIPLVVLLIGYIYYDPFRVIKEYKNYSYSQPVPHVIPNRDVINTDIFIENEKKLNYNSFIFGSSRTSAFTAADWKKHLNANDQIFFFDASGEAIYGIYTKLKYLDKVNAKIDNALILFCRDAIFKHTENFTTHLTIKHPAISGESKLYFHFVFFKAYLNLKFLNSFYNYTFTKKIKPFMNEYIAPGKTMVDSLSNGESLAEWDSEINKNPELYYGDRKKLFYERKGEAVDSIKQINEKSLYMLQEIKRILVKHNTNYKIVLSPIYDEVKFSVADLKILKENFGNNIFDFTGENQITRSKYNWYETKHFRTFIGDSILNVMYK